jgi:hypothetical protein
LEIPVFEYLPQLRLKLRGGALRVFTRQFAKIAPPLAMKAFTLIPANRKK